MILKDMNKPFIFLVLGIFLFSFVSAAPPFVSTTSNAGLTVDSLIFNTIKQNQDFTYHIHAYNSTSGLNVSNSSTKCYLHLYNSSGNHLLRQSPMDWDGNGDWELVISKGNFTKTGPCALEVWCISGVIGGSERIFFSVTPNGNDILDSEVSLFGISIWVIVLVTLFFFLMSYISKMPQVKILFMGLTSINIILLVGIMTTEINTYLSNYPNLMQIYNAYYIYILILASAAVLALMVWFIYYTFTTFNKTRGTFPED